MRFDAGATAYGGYEAIGDSDQPSMISIFRGPIYLLALFGLAVGVLGNIVIYVYGNAANLGLLDCSLTSVDSLQMCADRNIAFATSQLAPPILAIAAGLYGNRWYSVAAICIVLSGVDHVVCVLVSAATFSPTGNSTPLPPPEQLPPQGYRLGSDVGSAILAGHALTLFGSLMGVIAAVRLPTPLTRVVHGWSSAAHWRGHVAICIAAAALVSATVALAVGRPRDRWRCSDEASAAPASALTSSVLLSLLWVGGSFAGLARVLDVALVLSAVSLPVYVPLGLSSPGGPCDGGSAACVAGHVVAFVALLLLVAASLAALTLSEHKTALLPRAARRAGHASSAVACVVAAIVGAGLVCAEPVDTPGMPAGRERALALSLAVGTALCAGDLLVASPPVAVVGAALAYATLDATGAPAFAVAATSLAARLGYALLAAGAFAAVAAAIARTPAGGAFGSAHVAFGVAVAAAVGTLILWASRVYKADALFIGAVVLAATLRAAHPWMEFAYIAACYAIPSLTPFAPLGGSTGLVLVLLAVLALVASLALDNPRLDHGALFHALLTDVADEGVLS